MKICKTCGSQLEDYAAFCSNCGSAIEVPVQQPVAQAPIMQEPVVQQPVIQEPVITQPQYQQPPVNNNYAADFYAAVKQYIEIAGSAFVPSIIGLALSAAIPLIGQIVGLVMAGIVSKKIKSLPFIDESLLDATILEQYHSARRKVKTAGILTKINKIYSIVMLIFWIGYVIFWVFYLVFVVAFSVLANM
ncbi:MAG: zinc-ribbon domain-containing protein [Clostridia bacterium]|nr:zinc-ribbon domain-containing protein [Clostridia bacterium]